MFKRFLLAVALSGVWVLFCIKMGWLQMEPPKNETTEISEVAENAPSEASASPISQETTVAPGTENTDAIAIEPRSVVLENDHLALQIKNTGGVIEWARLKNYFVSVKHQDPVYLIVSHNRDYFPGEVVFSDGSRTLDYLYEMEQPRSNMVSLVYRRGGLEIRKTFELTDSFALQASVEVRGSDKSWHYVVAEGLQPLLPGDKLTPSFFDLGAVNPRIPMVAWSEDGDEGNTAVSKKWQTFQDRFEDPKAMDWFGIKDTYFANIFMPDQVFDNFQVGRVGIRLPGKEENAFMPVVAVSGNNSISGRFYLGPQEDETVAAFDQKLTNLISFGWAGLLSKGLYHLLEIFHGWVGNWGWAIVLLTLCLRIIMIPLMIPGLKSSFKMRELQPKMEKLKAKYSGDDLESKQKLQQEMFKLYKQEGVNPFSSCITMIVQMPVFFAYFSLLRSSISLRQADWAFWINDLSLKDPYYIFPIIMGVTMFLSTASMPMPNADPMQARMMKIMPVAFSVMFIGMPSGLILYMITSNLFSLGQTLVIRRRYQQA